MGNIKKFSVLIFLSLTMQIVLAQRNSTKVHLAVFDFEGRGISKAEAQALTDRFRSVLVSTNRFVVVEREKLQLILEEIGLQMSGAVESSAYSEAGKLLGVQRIITGTIGKVGDTYTVDIRVISVKTGKVIGTISENVRGSKENLILLLERLAKRMAGIRTVLQKYEVKIFSKPGGGSVYIDKRYVGLSPLIVRLSEGVHHIRIQYSGYKTWEGKIHVDQNTRKVVAKLEKQNPRWKKWLWVGAGVLVAGGGIAAAVLLGNSQTKNPGETETPIGFPPPPPSQ